VKLSDFLGIIQNMRLVKKCKEVVWIFIKYLLKIYYSHGMIMRIFVNPIN